MSKTHGSDTRQDIEMDVDAAVVDGSSFVLEFIAGSHDCGKVLLMMKWLLWFGGGVAWADVYPFVHE